MSRETMEDLNTNTLIGFTDEKGTAWHYRLELQGEESNHYPGAIPVDDVRRRLFYWQAQSAPVTVTFENANGESVTITDDTRQAIIRPDTAEIFGLFKSGYQIHQFDEWLLDLSANILDDSLFIGSAGLLQGGAIAWVQIEMPDTVETKEGERFRPYLLACTSHNGKLASTFKLQFNRVVCDNTLDGALAENGQTYKVKHSKYSNAKIESARDALGIIFKGADEFMREIESLCATEVSGKQFNSWVDEMVPLPETEGRAQTMAQTKRDQFHELYVASDMVAPWAGTAWGVLQTANTWNTHYAPIYKGANRGERNTLAAATGKTGEADRLALDTLNKILVNV